MSSQSSSDDYITFLLSVQKYLYRYGGLILIILGTINCILTLIAFTKKNLRKNPCSIYLTAYTIANFLYIYSSILPLTFTYGYDITLSKTNLIYCRAIFYMSFLFDILSPFYLILAAIDRILMTSSNALTRRRSTRRLAFTCIIIGTIFWMLFHSHTLIFVNIFEISPNYSICYFKGGLYIVLMGYYSLLIKGILVPLLMIIFGVWTWKNIRSMHLIRFARVAPVNRNVGDGGAHFIQSKDRQLIFMLLIDIIIYIFFTTLLSVVVVYQQITFNAQKSIEQTQTDLLVRNVGVFSSSIPYCVGCCGYLLVSKTFRNEVKKILLCK